MDRSAAFACVRTESASSRVRSTPSPPTASAKVCPRRWVGHGMGPTNRSAPGMRLLKTGPRCSDRCSYSRLRLRLGVRAHGAPFPASNGLVLFSAHRRSPCLPGRQAIERERDPTRRGKWSRPVTRRCLPRCVSKNSKMSHLRPVSASYWTLWPEGKTQMVEVAAGRCRQASWSVGPPSFAGTLGSDSFHASFQNIAPKGRSVDAPNPTKACGPPIGPPPADRPCGPSARCGNSCDWPSRGSLATSAIMVGRRPSAAEAAGFKPPRKACRPSAVTFFPEPALCQLKSRRCHVARAPTLK